MTNNSYFPSEKEKSPSSLPLFIIHVLLFLFAAPAFHQQPPTIIIIFSCCSLALWSAECFRPPQKPSLRTRQPRYQTSPPLAPIFITPFTTVSDPNSRSEFHSTITHSMKAHQHTVVGGTCMLKLLFQNMSYEW